MTSPTSLILNPVDGAPITVRQSVIYRLASTRQDPEWTENLSLPFLHVGSCSRVLNLDLVLVFPIPEKDQAQRGPDLRISPVLTDDIRGVVLPRHMAKEHHSRGNSLPYPMVTE